MPKQRAWEKRWQTHNKIGRGGQGTTYLVTSLTEGGQYALKSLNQQKDPERRKRMHREVTALRTLEHIGIPKIIESNSEQYDRPYRDLSVS